MGKQTSRRYTLRLTAELEELIETQRAELWADLRIRIQHTDGLTPAYAIRDLVASGVVEVMGGNVALAPVTGPTTRKVALYIPRGQFEQALTEIAQIYGLTTHATLRALIVAGASS
jgi:hypothetical protein